MIWVGTIINGVLLGGLYGLFGVGLALVFGVTRIINIMHGEFIALSAFIALGVAAVLPNVHPLLLILPVVVVSFAPRLWPAGYFRQPGDAASRSFGAVAFDFRLVGRSCAISWSKHSASIRAASARAISLS